MVSASALSAELVRCFMCWLSVSGENPRDGCAHIRRSSCVLSIARCSQSIDAFFRWYLLEIAKLRSSMMILAHWGRSSENRESFEHLQQNRFIKRNSFQNIVNNATHFNTEIVNLISF